MLVVDICIHEHWLKMTTPRGQIILTSPPIREEESSRFIGYTDVPTHEDSNQLSRASTYPGENHSFHGIAD